MNKPLSRIQLNTISDVHSETVQPQHMVMRALRKVPELTFYFWIIKLLTTAFGESASDTMVTHLSPVIAVALGGIGLVVALILQFTVRRYVAWVYWFAVTMVAVFGTMAADVIHVGLGIPYQVSTIGFAVALAVIFVVWYITEKTLSVHSIYTRRRELFYWATVMTTFALGTAAGDMTASTLHLGFLASGVLFGILFALPALGHWLLRLNGILAFWFAYIMTRPFGASFADWLGRPLYADGIGLGRAQVTLALAVLIIGFVGYLTVTRKDIKVEER